ncbi:MAG TPA: hypothetical protein VIO38_06475 [Rariglobus sp.]
MKKLLFALIALLTFAGCSTPNRMVYSSGFSFANYDYAFVSKMDGASTALYGTDIEFANLLSRYNIKIVGDKEFTSLPKEAQARTMYARVSISVSGKLITLSVSFDDAVTGKTGANFTTFGKGKILDGKAREKIFEDVSRMITKAISEDKKLVVRDMK